MEEKLCDVVSAYRVGDDGSLVVVIPKRAAETEKISPGDRLAVKTDESGRVIYEPTRKETSSKTGPSNNSTR